MGNFASRDNPGKYEELQKEAWTSLKPEIFEGARFDYAKPINPSFSFAHSVLMGPVEAPANVNHIVKIPTAQYEFGVNLIDQTKFHNYMIGRIMTDGRLTGRIKYDLTESLGLRLQTQLTPNPVYSQAMLDVDLKGNDWQAQIKFGNNAFYGMNYLQSVTTQVALGGEVFWLGVQKKSGVGLAAKWASSNAVATLQVATTGLLSSTYAHKVADKLNLVTELSWSATQREANAAVGYDYTLRQSRIRGKIDSTGVVSAYLEEQMQPGVTLLFSGEIDHAKGDYKFGLGLTLGE